MAALTVTPITRAGVVQTLVAAAGGGDTFANTGQEMLTIANGGGGPITVTAVSTVVIDTDLAVGDKSITVNAGDTQFFGPFQTGIYSATVGVTYSGVASVTVNPFSLANVI